MLCRYALTGKEVNSILMQRLIKVDGKVTKVTNFGVFVEILDGLEGLLHVSELGSHTVETLPVDAAIKVKVLNVEIDTRKIGLSMKDVV